jgi:DNA polymerase
VFLLPLIHPAAALRTPALVDTLREDFAKLPELIERPLPEGDTRAPTVAELAVTGGEAPADQLDLFG